eukprot:1138591-Pelagomonas_calceolata.AAC.2
MSAPLLGMWATVCSCVMSVLSFYIVLGCHILPHTLKWKKAGMLSRSVVQINHLGGLLGLQHFERSQNFPAPGIYPGTRPFVAHIVDGIHVLPGKPSWFMKKKHSA